MSRNNHHEIWSVTVIEITTVKEKKKITPSLGWPKEEI